METGLQWLPRDQQERIYGVCAKGCANTGVMAARKKLFDLCKGQPDGYFARMGELGGVETKILEAGRRYEICYPTCTCPLYTKGIRHTKRRCECSRQRVSCTFCKR